MSCTYQAEEADLVVHNAVIYSLDENNTISAAMAIKDGKIIELGAERQILNKYKAEEVYDAKQRVIYPGFIDPHSHFIGYALSLNSVNLVGTKSWEEVLQRTIEFAKSNAHTWITGRGWDQNDWELKEFPNRQELDSLFPDTPVMLKRIDGHAAIVNAKAIEIAGLQDDAQIDGGTIGLENGVLTGLLIDNAMPLVESFVEDIDPDQKKSMILKAQENCLKKGLSSVCDAGLSFSDIELIRSMHESGELKIKVYAMITDEEQNYLYFEEHGPIKTDRLTVKSFKFYADGALGSRGACLIEPYSDVDNEYRGLMLIKEEYFKEKLRWCDERGFQVSTHAIGDSAVRMVLNSYASVLRGTNDKRWRIEHSQIVHPDDISLFGEYTIIPSVQPTHATSDMYWAEQRLGPERMPYAYNWKDLKNQLGFIPLGTDFPIEDIDPIKTFYSACIRKDVQQTPAQGFQMNSALSREEALLGMTLWAALSNFEEEDRGSLEIGKSADFVVFDRDILKIAEEDILDAKCISTFVNGENLFSLDR